jgi:hypothetical protein
MGKLIKILTYLSAMLGAMLFMRPKDNSTRTLLWIPKLFGGALSPILGISGVIGALVDLTQRGWKLVGAGMSARFIVDLPNSQDQFASAFGSNWQARLPASLHASQLQSRIRAIGRAEFQNNLVIGQKPNSGKPFLADHRQPQPGIPRSGLG